MGWWLPFTSASGQETNKHIGKIRYVHVAINCTPRWKRYNHLRNANEFYVAKLPNTSWSHTITWDVKKQSQLLRNMMAERWQKALSLSVFNEVECRDCTQRPRSLEESAPLVSPELVVCNASAVCLSLDFSVKPGWTLAWAVSLAGRIWKTGL